MQNVLEHTSDPLANLREAYRLLKPGGCLMIITPNYQGLSRKILGRRWFHFKPGEHLSYFSKKTIVRALTGVGMTQVKTFPSRSALRLNYFFERLRHYHRGLFSRLMNLAKAIGLHEYLITVRTGELEAWGQKEQTASIEPSQAVPDQAP
jgi:SAM-dependent methyltransferase